jgi:hypothetical protein
MKLDGQKISGQEIKGLAVRGQKIEIDSHSKGMKLEGYQTRGKKFDRAIR